MPAFAHVTPLPAVAALARLTYAVPEALAESVRPGVRVMVPLGPRRVTALVIGTAEEAPQGVQCRAILSLLDDCPIVTDKLLKLLEWMADYYLSSLGETLSLAVGRSLTATSKKVVALRDGSAAQGELERRVVQILERAGKPLEPAHLAHGLGRRTIDRLLATLAERGVIAIDDLLGSPRAKTRYETVVTVERIPDEATESALFTRAPKRRALFDHLLTRPHRSATASELAELFPSASASLPALAEAGLIRLSRNEMFRAPASASEHYEAPQLTEPQARAVSAIEAALGSFSTFLLQGVTASGKTEVYLRSVESVLARGGGALVLVPEISLTHQVVARLRGRFGDLVAVLHSELSPGERWDEWRRIARGQARIAVGARSAVLAPLPSLGIIIIDEEHEAAYKQDDGVRYHARDTAVMRARIEGCPVVLGSATPSLESWRHAREGRYQALLLPHRVTASPPPRIEAIDLRGRDVAAGGGLSEQLIEAMKENFAASGQTLLFLNRRGFARSLQCWQCGGISKCSECSVALTLHQNDRSLRCHHCGDRRAVPAVCPDCQNDALFAQGVGTERLEATVRTLLPRARIARLDRDTAGERGFIPATLTAWKRREVDVLIGTQMIAKGHDVPGVTLVGVIDADLSLNVPDFRSAERTFQLITQVAGRAGRGSESGRVLVQTYSADVAAIACALASDFESFAAGELADREELGYPPVRRMGVLRVEGPERSTVERLSEQAARAMQIGEPEADGFTVKGPSPATIERIQGRYRYRVMTWSPRASVVRHALLRGRAAIAQQARSAKVRVLVDVDPVDMF
ncbi:MAG TPA: primosomal protein N' [Candidatus Binatia bacterium]|nr:primosomal protein N' [Candidatus Binatia bacterium]